MPGHLIRRNREWAAGVRADATGPQGLEPTHAAGLARLDAAGVPA